LTISDDTPSYLEAIALLLMLFASLLTKAETPILASVFKSLWFTDTDASDPMLNWDADDLRHAFASNGHCVQVVVEKYLTPMHISDNFIKRLFAANLNRPSYADRLAANLTSEEINIIKNLFVRYLLNQSVNWSSTVAFFNISG
jgi:hypothetical protein